MRRPPFFALQRGWGQVQDAACTHCVSERRVLHPEWGLWQEYCIALALGTLLGQRELISVA